MSYHKATNMERLMQQLQDGDPPRSPLRLTDDYIQADFDRAARDDLWTAINAEFAIPTTEYPAPLVVHYTSIDTVVSMLQDPRDAHLRMYSTIGANDPSEGTYVNTADLTGDNGFQSATPKYAYVASFIQLLDRQNPSKAADNLVFWRSYGREGTGCSLTVRVPREQLMAVKYGRKHERDSIANLRIAIDGLLETTQSVAAAIGASAQTFGQLVDTAVGKIRYLYKSEAYEYEKESRIVETASTIKDKGMTSLFDYSGPPGQKWPKRYINHPSLCIRSLFTTGSVITLGPAVQQRSETQDYLKDLSNRANRPYTQVRCSTLPYRRSTNYQ